MKNDIVTLATFSSGTEANIAASMLKSMGIEVEVVNEISTNILPYINDNVVRIIVSAEDCERAKSLLQAEYEKNINV